MKGRPLPVVMVSLLFILTGCIGFAYHINDFSKPNASSFELIWVLFLRILAVVCGLLLFFRMNWARWLAIAWLAYHVIISAFNSSSEMLAHIVFLVIVTFLLFLPVSSKYFKNKNKQNKVESSASW
jgi:hypothetical protein